MIGKLEVPVATKLFGFSVISLFNRSLKASFRVLLTPPPPAFCNKWDMFEGHATRWVLFPEAIFNKCAFTRLKWKLISKMRSCTIGMFFTNCENNSKKNSMLIHRFEKGSPRFLKLHRKELQLLVCKTLTIIMCGTLLSATLM